MRVDEIMFFHFLMKNYTDSFFKHRRKTLIALKSDTEIDQMKRSCQLAAQTLKFIEPYIQPGITTLELNDLCHNYIINAKAIPAPLNYRGYPKSICTSINDVVCHGIPSSKTKLKEGDIINIDITTIFEEFHGDTSETYIVGKADPKAVELVRVAKECLWRGIDAVKSGGRVGDIGAAIQAYADKYKFGVVREFVGHGIGRNFHEDPQIPHFGKKGEGLRLEPGMTFTIEPMINQGHWKTKVRKDGWTAVTIDGSFSAQFEHTLAIRSDGTIDILTQLDN
jgi:methionyl aminopeptidase